MNKLIIFIIGLAIGLACSLYPGHAGVIEDSLIKLAGGIDNLQAQINQLRNTVNTNATAGSQLTQELNTLKNRVTRLENRRRKQAVESLVKE